MQGEARGSREDCSAAARGNAKRVNPALIQPLHSNLLANTTVADSQPARLLRSADTQNARCDGNERVYVDIRNTPATAGGRRRRNARVVGDSPRTGPGPVADSGMGRSYKEKQVNPNPTPPARIAHGGGGAEVRCSHSPFQQRIVYAPLASVSERNPILSPSCCLHRQAAVFTWHASASPYRDVPRPILFWRMRQHVPIALSAHTHDARCKSADHQQRRHHSFVRSCAGLFAGDITLAGCCYSLASCGIRQSASSTQLANANPFYSPRMLLHRHRPIPKPVEPYHIPLNDWSEESVLRALHLTGAGVARVVLHPSGVKDEEIDLMVAVVSSVQSTGSSNPKSSSSRRLVRTTAPRAVRMSSHIRLEMPSNGQRGNYSRYQQIVRN